MLKTFRIVAYLEGISLIVLMGIAMPVKYVLGNPLLVRYVGWVHGLLFVAYLAVLAMLSSEFRWPAKKSMAAVIASVIPFGTFWFDRKLSHEAHE